MGLRWYGTAVRWIVFTNIYVAACGAALTAATDALLDQTPRLGPVAALVFCCTLVIYNLDRLVEPNPGDTEHERWIAAHPKPLWVLTAAASIGAALLVTQLPLRCALSLIPAGAIAIGYCAPVLPYRRGWLRLKQLPGAKLLLIAGVWTYATTGLPILNSGIELNADTWAILTARFLFLAAVALPFDLPDIQRDRLSGIVTLPTLFSVATIRWLAVGLALGGALAGVLNPWPAAAAVVISCIVAAGMLLALRPGRGVWFFMVALDGLLLFQAGTLWIAAST